MNPLNHKNLITLFVFFVISSQLFGGVRRFRAIINSDPSTSMTIGFDQYNSSSNPFDDEGTPFLYYDTVNHGQNPFDYANGTTVDRTVDYKGMENNFVRLTGLTPNTRYYFVVKDDQEVSQVYYFETLPDDPTERLSLIAGGDSRDIPILADDIGRQNANRLVAKLRAHAVIFGGDYTFSDDITHPVDANEWPEWMDDWQLTIAADGRITPIIAARGNHEYDEESVPNFFDIPNSDAYFSIELGGGLVRTITLNSEISRLGDQLTWLENDLANSCATWKIAQYHRPTRPHESGKDEQDDQADFWSPLFEEHGVQLVIESDAHLSKYTFPIKRSTVGGSEGFERDDEDGVVYIGEGGWGAELRTPDDNKPWTVASAEINQFKWIFVDQNNIEIRTIQTDNEAAVVAKTDMESKFSMPTGIDIWNPVSSSASSGVMSYSNGLMTLSNPTDTNPTINLGGNQDLPNGTSITLDAGVGFDSYVWNTGEVTPTITISTTGVYNVTVVDNGCLKTGTMTAQTPVSVSELEESGVTFEVSPNPAKDFIQVQISSPENRDFTLSLISNNGQLIISQELNNIQNEQADFNLKNLPTGIYFMVLENNGKKSTQKFIITK